MIFGIVPLVFLLVLLRRLLGRAKEKLADDLLPELGENAQEAIRKQQRKHWEKKHLK